eukprot:m.56278 g.56278  ORF g.56278 m.56278 type:complete len:265 (-) comp11550_c0_seq1:1672-2466(-)
MVWQAVYRAAATRGSRFMHTARKAWSPERHSTALSILQASLSGNDKFKSERDYSHFAPFQQEQTPSMTVVGCSDSRVHAQLFGLDPANNLFAIRNIGNQIETARGSVDFGVRNLHSKVLFVLGHSSCGAIRAAMDDYSGQADCVRAELDSISSHMVKPESLEDDAVLQQTWKENIERNVDFQVNFALKEYSDLVAEDKLIVIGGVYDFNNVYNQGYGALLIVNVNGETHVDKIKQHPIIAQLDEEALKHVARVLPCNGDHSHGA